MPHLSAVGISGLQAGEDVNHRASASGMLQREIDRTMLIVSLGLMRMRYAVVAIKRSID
ncbi:Uncharacterised protein [Oligella urethralis]|uniref:Uncharacterized protein n=1 Tax=Oligella urethralis TaxID=90245 RepID=A0A2X1UK31_9BURK|nr:Uncharacterised protein [Oligella urethralis]SPY07498.1 Uncharacterised protein [Oligella urethralis]SUA66077.1 Uncharacterised protein [Oligella urethralis]